MNGAESVADRHTSSKARPVEAAIRHVKGLAGNSTAHVRSFCTRTWASRTPTSAVRMYGETMCVPAVVHIANLITYCIAAPHDSARKQIHPSSTTPSVSRREKTFHVNSNPGADLNFASGSHVIHALWIASETPCNAPQNTKFQLAPCHNPPNIIVTIKLM